MGKRRKKYTDVKVADKILVFLKISPPARAISNKPVQKMISNLNGIKSGKALMKEKGSNR
jgi:hypothetical protein